MPDSGPPTGVPLVCAMTSVDKMEWRNPINPVRARFKDLIHQTARSQWGVPTFSPQTTRVFFTFESTYGVVATLLFAYRKLLVHAMVDSLRFDHFARLARARADEARGAHNVLTGLADTLASIVSPGRRK